MQLVVASWKDDCDEAGIDVHGVGAKHRLSVMRVIESQFADDVALYTKSWYALEQSSRNL